MKTSNKKTDESANTTSSKVTSPPSKPAAAKSAKSVSDIEKVLSSKVERYFAQRSGRQVLYAPTEKIPIVEVGNFPSLGQLTALRFLEWVSDNPEGVVSLPTGKTPEYFIKWTQRYLQNWDSDEVQHELGEMGLSGKKKPDLRGLHFVQIDEFYPIDPAQKNSFHYYVSKHYIRGFGLDKNRAMLIDPSTIGIPAGTDIDNVFPNDKVDLSLRSRQAESELEELQQKVIVAVDQFCSEYEEQIRAKGGIGFFLGGIGPDGHIGFNARGSHLYSPTRLTLTNYETEAAAAGDLGGIEIARHKPVITIGLGTITYKPDAVVIIFAAGDAKAKVVADAVQNPKSVEYPASVLQDMKNARFYLTKGATVRLRERHLEDIIQAEELSEEMVEKAVIDRACTLGKRLDEMKDADVGEDELLKQVLNRTGRNLHEAAGWTREQILKKIDRGLRKLTEQTFLHTGPHHDDIMLGYMPYVMRLVREPSNKHYFNVLTSGFTAVTNGFLAKIFHDVDEYLARGEFDADLANHEFDADNDAARAAEVYYYLDGIASMDEEIERRAQARRMLYNLIHVYEEEDFENLRLRIRENLHYLETLYPGKKDIPIIQKLKGMQREYEEELIWGYLGSSPHDVFHSRLGFYTGDIFTEQPTVERDVVPVLKLIHKLKPTIVTITFDPEGSGPDTHYKVLQVLNEALVRYNKETGKSPTIWGYRNVWYKFHPSETNIFVPTSLNTMAVMRDSFLQCFGSQKDASFPSFEYDGPFCDLAQQRWVEQFKMLQTCLGDRFFIENKSPQLRATRGFVFIKEMTLDQFAGSARSLAQATEAAYNTGD